MCVTKIGSTREMCGEPCSAGLWNPPFGHLSDTGSAHQPSKHAQVFQRPLEGYFLPSSNLLYRQISGFRRLGSRTGEVCADTWHSSVSKVTSKLQKSISLCHHQFYLEPQGAGHSVPRDPTMVCLDRRNIGETPGKIHHFSPREALDLDLTFP